MRKAYYIECKTSAPTSNGFYVMVPDMGIMPLIEMSEENGRKSYDVKINTYVKIRNYEIHKEYPLDEVGEGNCIARTELHHKTLGNITFISLYEIWI